MANFRKWLARFALCVFCAFVTGAQGLLLPRDPPPPGSCLQSTGTDATWVPCKQVADTGTTPSFRSLYLRGPSVFGSVSWAPGTVHTPTGTITVNESGCRCLRVSDKNGTVLAQLQEFGHGDEAIEILAGALVGDWRSSLPKLSQ